MRKRWKEMSSMERVATLMGFKVYTVEELDTWSTEEVEQYAVGLIRAYERRPRIHFYFDFGEVMNLLGLISGAYIVIRIILSL